MATEGQTPPIFGVVQTVEAPPDLVDLLTAAKVITREMLNRELSTLERISVRLVMGELLDVALELVAGEDRELSDFTQHGFFNDLPY